jgi:cobalt-zinc-cadmium efflux system outer membrane protein
MGVLSLFLLSTAHAQTLPPALGQAEKVSLQEAIRLAMENNPNVLRARKEIDAAGGRILQAGRIPNPELEASWNETPTNFNIADADERDVGIRQQIEFPGKRSNRIDVATHERSIVEFVLERTKTLVTAQVKSAYYNLLLSQEVVRSLQEQIKLFKDLQDLLTSRYQAGQANYLDVIRVKVEITRLSNDLAEALRENRLRKSQLNLIIGLSADQPFEASDSLSYTPLSVDRDSVVNRLLSKSATLMIAQRSIVRQQSLLSLAKTSYLPDFSLGLFHQRRAEEPPFDANRFLGTTTNSVGIQLGVSIPLWFWQEPKGQVQEAAALVDIASLTYASVERRVKANVSNAFDLLKVMETQLKVFDETLLLDSQDILSTAIAQYQNNQIDILNLFDVYRTYRATKVEYARALYNYAAALTSLEAAAELPAEE